MPARLERVFVADDTRALAPEALAALRGHRRHHPAAGHVAAARARERPRPLSTWSIRWGNVMMRFPADAEPRRMFRDLERLLKASQIG